jgi:hypothetical protein
MSEDFRAAPAPAGDAGPQIRLVTIAAGVGALLLVASVLADVARADDPVAPQLPNLPRPTLPRRLPTNLPTNLPSDLPSEFPTDLPSNFPTDLPTDFPTGLPDGLPDPPRAARR